jgi:hypothetical protein
MAMIGQIIGLFKILDQDLNAVQVATVYEPIGHRQGNFEFFTYPLLDYVAATEWCSAKRASVLFVHPYMVLNDLF